MAVSATSLFANSNQAGQAIPGLTTMIGGGQQQAKQERPAANYWLNVGYTVQVTVEDGTIENRFVSLPVGIPLDTQKPVSTNSKNAETAALLAAKNNLLEQVNALAQTLQPGEERIVNLQLQLRRVNSDADVVSTVNNPFITELAL